MNHLNKNNDGTFINCDKLSEEIENKPTTSSSFSSIIRWFKKTDNNNKIKQLPINKQTDKHDNNLSSSCDSILSIETIGFKYIKPLNYKQINNNYNNNYESINNNNNISKKIIYEPDTDTYKKRLNDYNKNKNNQNNDLTLKSKYLLLPDNEDTLTRSFTNVYDNYKPIASTSTTTLTPTFKRTTLVKQRQLNRTASTTLSTDDDDEDYGDDYSDYNDYNVTHNQDIHYTDLSLPNTRNTNNNNNNNIQNNRKHRRTVSDSYKDKKSGSYIHVKGKRKAPEPPNPIKQSDSNNTTLGRKKRQAPQPPIKQTETSITPTRSSIKLSTESGGLFDDKEIKELIEGSFKKISNMSKYNCDYIKKPVVVGMSPKVQSTATSSQSVNISITEVTNLPSSSRQISSASGSSVSLSVIQTRSKLSLNETPQTSASTTPATSTTNIASPTENEQPSNEVILKNDTLKLESGILKSIVNVKKLNSLGNTDNAPVTKKTEPQISPRPWYKRSLTNTNHNRDTLIPFKKEIILKTIDKRRNKKYNQNTNENRNSIFDASNKFNIFSKFMHNNSGNQSDNSEKRKSGINIPNISELDREAAEIITNNNNNNNNINNNNDRDCLKSDNLFLKCDRSYLSKLSSERDPNELDPLNDLLTKSDNQSKTEDNNMFKSDRDPLTDLLYRNDRDIFKSDQRIDLDSDGDEVRKTTKELISKFESSSNKPKITINKTFVERKDVNYFGDLNKKGDGANEIQKKTSDTSFDNLLGKWQCPYCTLENPNWRIICEVCERIKPYDKRVLIENKLEQVKQAEAETIVEPKSEDKEKKIETPDTEWDKKQEKMFKYFNLNTDSDNNVKLIKSTSEISLESNFDTIKIDSLARMTGTKIYNENIDLNNETEEIEPMIVNVVKMGTPNLNEVRSARIAKFMQNNEKNNDSFDKEDNTNETEVKNLTTDEKILTFNDHNTLEKEKERLREMIRSMNARALAEKYPVIKPQTEQQSQQQQPQEQTNIEKSDDNKEVVAVPVETEQNKFGAIKKLFKNTKPVKISTSVQTGGVIRKLSNDNKVQTMSVNDLDKDLDGTTINSYKLINENEFNQIRDNKILYANLPIHDHLLQRQTPPQLPPRNNNNCNKKIENIYENNYDNEIELLTNNLITKNDIDIIKKNNFNINEATDQVNKTNTIVLNKLMRNLELSIANGNYELAGKLAKNLAQMKITLSVTRQKDEILMTKEHEELLNVEMFVEDKLTHKGPIQLLLNKNLTLLQLKEKIFNDYNLPINIQRWIINNNLAIDDNKLLIDYDLKDKTIIYLYLVEKINDEKTNRGAIADVLNKKEISENLFVRNSSNEDVIKATITTYTTQFNDDEKELNIDVKVNDNDDDLIGAVGLTENNNNINTNKDDEIEKELSYKTLKYGWVCQVCNLINTPTKKYCYGCMEICPKSYKIPFNLNNINNNIIKNNEENNLNKCNLNINKTNLYNIIINNDKPQQYINNNTKQQQKQEQQQDNNLINIPKPLSQNQRDNIVMTIITNNPNITRNKYRGVDNFNPKIITKTASNEPSTSGLQIVQQQKNCDKKLPKSHYNELLNLDNQDLIYNFEDFECPICFLEYKPGEGIILHNCLHVFCVECLKSTIIHNDDVEIKCPYMNNNYSCDYLIQEREIRSLVTTDIYEKYLLKSIKLAENKINNTFHCKTVNCRGWCIYEDNVNQFKCPVCKINNCLTCQVIHDGLNCKQYQDRMNSDCDSNAEARRTKEMLNDMIEKGEAMNCPTCQVILMKKWGCDWLRCSMCKTEICWVTRGPRWGLAGKGDTTSGCKCGVNGVKCHPKCNYCH